MIGVSHSVHQAFGTSPSVVVDAYVPLNVAAQHSIPLSRAIRFGDVEQSLLEVFVDDKSTVLGFTLIGLKSTHIPATPPTDIPRHSGWPTLRVADEVRWRGRDGSRFVDLGMDFSVNIDTDFIDVDIGGIAASTAVFVAGPVSFYADKDRLTAIKVADLSRAMVELFRSHVPEPALEQ